MSPARIALSIAAASGLQLLCEQPCGAQSTSIENTDDLIIVTAQRRPERSEDVPISLTAKSEKNWTECRATDMAGLGKAVPSLVMTRTSVFTQPFIRGVGKRSNLGGEWRRNLCRRGLPRIADQRAARFAGNRAGRSPERAAGHPVRTQCNRRSHPGHHATPDRTSRPN